MPTHPTELIAPEPPIGAKRRRVARPQADVLSDRVANQLRDDILTGRLAPGTRIRQEALAEQFGVSRIPIREALRRLESDGLVVLRANSGAWVGKLDRAEFIETYLIRERLEPLAIQQSVPHLTAEQIERLHQLQEEIDAAANVEDYLRKDREFHLLTFAGAPMPMLLKMIERFWNTTQHYRRMYTDRIRKEDFWITNTEHRLIVEAIMRRDPEDAAHLVLGHVRRTRVELTKSGV